MGKRGRPLSVAKYATAADPEHPTAHSDGRVRIHRAVLFDKIGPGEHPCSWCGAVVEWFGEGRRELVADHLDENTWNNDPSNLVASCLPCNSARHGRSLTTCSRGHEFTEENTYRRPDREGRGRMCRECQRMRGRKPRRSAA